MNRRSIWAIVAGIVSVIVVTTVIDIVLHAVGVFPPLAEPIDDRLALVASSYRVVLGIAGAWLTARLAPNRPMTHAMVLGYLGTIVGIVGVVSTWNLGLGPHWYPISIAVLAIPQCWVGGRIAARQGARG